MSPLGDIQWHAHCFDIEMRGEVADPQQSGVPLCREAAATAPAEENMLAQRTTVGGIASLVLAALAAVNLVALAAPSAHAGDYDLPIMGTPIQVEEDPIDDPEEDDPPRLFDEEIPTTSDSVIFVVDRSSSMELPIGTYMNLEGQPVSDGTRLDFVKAELTRSIRSIPDNFSFNIIIYSECVDSWRGSRVEANPSNKSSAEGYVNAITPYGWTNTGGATQQALNDHENMVVMLLSDGAPNFLDCAQTYVGDFDTHKRLVRTTNSQRATINCFGIGLDPDTRTFMQQVAAENGGTFRELD